MNRYLLLFTLTCCCVHAEDAEHHHEDHLHPKPKASASPELKKDGAAAHDHDAMGHEHAEHGGGPHDHGAGHESMKGMLGQYAMSRESSGTSWQPDAAPMMGQHWMKNDWMLMLHGSAQVVYTNQGGKRGDDKFFSNNMLMFMATHEAGNGTFGFRTMLSAEPFTIGKQGYPELLQTGETANGKTPLIDRQHPHDLFMELAASYSYNLSKDSSLFTYFGYPGEPALGPPTFMHRFSGMEFPEAPIMHHWLDSTHITFGVATIGYIWKDLKFDASIFTGREPDENRYDFDPPKFDSYSFRLSYNPTKCIALQVSYGHLNSPEQLEPKVDVERVTFSAMYHRNWNGKQWQTTLAFGNNNNHPHGNSLPGVLLESALTFDQRHTALARAEWVEKDELFKKDDPRADKSFNVGKVSAGYIYDVYAAKNSSGRIGIGVLGSVGILPDSLHHAYGDLPLSGTVFVRMKF